MGGEEDVGLGVGGGEGEDVEGVGGDYVGGEEVDLGGGVGDAVVVEVAFVGVAAVVDGAFDLDAEEVAEVVDGEVVGGAVAAGLGEDESEFGGAELEAEFGPFSAAFGVRDVGGWVAIWHGGPWGGAIRPRNLGVHYGPAIYALTAEKEVPRDEAARNDNVQLVAIRTFRQ